MGKKEQGVFFELEFFFRSLRGSNPTAPRSNHTTMPPTPRVDATDYHSGQHSGRMVRVTGKLLSVEGDRAQLEMSGGGAPAAVVFNDASLAAEFDASLVGSGHFEVIGTLQAPPSRRLSAHRPPPPRRARASRDGVAVAEQLRPQ